MTTTAKLFNPPKFNQCADPDSKRYALGGVMITPCDAENVYMTATDGRMMAVRKTPGTVTGRAIIPASMVAKLPPRKPREITLDDGQWQATDGAAAGEVEGRFPRAWNVIPERNASDYLPVRIDAARLARIAEAIGDDGQIILMIPRDVNHGENESGKAMLIGGRYGSGLLMPVSGERHNYSDTIPEAEQIVSDLRTIRETMQKFDESTPHTADENAANMSRKRK